MLFEPNSLLGKKNSCNPLGLGKGLGKGWGCGGGGYFSEVISTKAADTHPEYSECANNPKLTRRISLFAAIFDQFQIWRVQMVAAGAATLVLRFRHVWCYRRSFSETWKQMRMEAKALCNVNYNSPAAVTFLSPPLTPGRKNASSSQTKRNFSAPAKSDRSRDHVARHFLSFHWHRTRVATESSRVSAASWNGDSFSLGWASLVRIQHNN